MKVTFKKLSNRWFVDIPYDGDISDLEMVMGADTLIESLKTNNSDIKTIEIVTVKTPYELRKLEEDEFGATYYADALLFQQEIWLCPVTKLVLGKYPNVINFEIT